MSCACQLVIKENDDDDDDDQHSRMYTVISVVKIKKNIFFQRVSRVTPLPSGSTTVDAVIVRVFDNQPGIRRSSCTRRQLLL